MPATIAQRIAFRDKTASIFEKVLEQFNIQPRIGLVQSADESNWGISELAVTGQNIFGLTPGDSWLAFMRKEKPAEEVPKWGSFGIETVYFPTTEYDAHPPEQIRFFDFPGDIVEKRPDGKGGSILTIKRHFRKYANWEESALDWGRKIATHPRYRFAYDAAKAGDLLAYAAAIQRSGYATDPNYSATIVQVGRAIAALPGANV